MNNEIQGKSVRRHAHEENSHMLLDIRRLKQLGNGLGEPDLINDILRPSSPSNLWNMVKRPNMWPKGRESYFIYPYYTSTHYYFTFTVQYFDNKYIKCNL